MPSIIYMPWLSISEDMIVGDFALVRYVRERRPLSGQDQIDLDRLLGVCREPEEQNPISEATLIGLQGRPLTDDLSDHEETRIAVFTELLAFSGLSAREFFNPLGSYVNRQSFEARRASFRSLGSMYGVIVRKRDGGVSHGIDEEGFRLLQPLSTYGSARNLFDIPLVTELLELQDSSDWGRLYEAIQNFNIANTDSDSISEQMEIVYMTGAFERLFDSHDEGEIARRIATLTSSITMESVDTSTVVGRGSRVREAASLTTAWFRDLYRLRNNHSHGRVESGYRSSWKRHEHLLLGAYLLPLLFKLKLSTMSGYRLSEDDDFDLYVFENLAAADLFSSPADPQRSGDNHWRRIRNSKRLGWSLRRAAEAHGT